MSGSITLSGFMSFNILVAFATNLSNHTTFFWDRYSDILSMRFITIMTVFFSFSVIRLLRLMVSVVSLIIYILLWRKSIRRGVDMGSPMGSIHRKGRGGEWVGIVGYFDR